ncbi:PqqD family protein [Mesorhizobium sp. ES1-1]|uniref:PqqD family protein n=1 Tax=Mesorhizobium sp. ES1-1 TaxID=2876629 RepID=UPI001CCD9415|nr:PqqD family protein [Mesorhizobium sp. ES1-1]MBZ9676600.1 PqqD family protein [Mesorhizobium sp. ES1-1]
MQTSGIYTIASKDIVFESFDGEAVVLDLTSGKYFGFSDSGSRLWDALSSGVPAAELAGVVTGAGPLSATDIDGFVSQLLEFGLLAPVSDAPAQPLSGTLLAQLADTTEPLKVDIHDDLADLIVVDPIHEVEEPLGWPAVKQAT